MRKSLKTFEQSGFIFGLKSSVRNCSGQLNVLRAPYYRV